MAEIFMGLFQYAFLTRALIVGVLVSLCAALLGVTLVLKRYSMIGDGLSHVGFGALAIAMALNLAPMAVAIPLVVASAFLLLRLNERSGISGDSAIALLSTGALTVGVIVASLSTGMNVDVYNYMFGSILAMSQADLYLAIALCAFVIAMYLLLYNRIFLVTFDDSFARAGGANVSLLNALIALLTAVTIVIGMRMMGTLLISSLIVFPALSAMRLCKRFRSVVLLAGAVSVVSVVVGLLCSLGLSIPAGASVVAANMVVFGLFCLIQWIGRARV